MQITVKRRQGTFTPFECTVTVHNDDAEKRTFVAEFAKEADGMKLISAYAKETANDKRVHAWASDFLKYATDYKLASNDALMNESIGGRMVKIHLCENSEEFFFVEFNKDSGWDFSWLFDSAQRIAEILAHRVSYICTIAANVRKPIFETGGETYYI